MTIHNTTFSVYKISPLHNFSETRLEFYANELSVLIDRDSYNAVFSPIEISSIKAIQIDIQTPSSTYSSYLFPPHTLLIRSPSHVINTILEYLSTHFDCRTSEFKFTQNILISLFDIFLSSASANPIIKPLELTYSPLDANLKKITLSIEPHDIEEFKKRGSLVECLTGYVKYHTAIDLNQIQLVRIGCAGFVAGDSKLKIFKNTQTEDIFRAVLKNIER
ncbi:Kinetochore protein fta1 [Neolecta irregularis DAH-3]|uniref:Kinetochore protein fta1 n=1 Tax=Neolecta irregularis (strain DAH-3) TaxID=1198029 RepID=A0A1U7LJ77_NEOID|nr:Kinetochore protein fta1 [Neolecta irregularis DAH-3]|eukprot:OLL22710.1 Kinetochore protein fta1 [Neolecta irregularis DAH-3]